MNKKTILIIVICVLAGVLLYFLTSDGFFSDFNDINKIGVKNGSNSI